MIGPKQHTIWSCDWCDNLKLDGAKYYCGETYRLIDWSTPHITPSNCPYLKTAIVERCIEKQCLPHELER